MLIEVGAELNLVDKDHRTALMLSIGMGHTQVSRLLIEAGADLN
jgi:ankyrin repeat protein